jgi:hypothetical protein
LGLLARAARSKTRGGSLSHGVLAGPLTGGGLVLGLVILVDVSDLGHERIVGVGVGQQGADREQHLRDREGGGPLILQDVETDRSVRVDVGVVDSSCEGNLRRLEWVVRGEVYVQEVHSTGVWGIIGSHDGSLPVELVLLVERASRAVGGGISSEVDEFLLNSFKSHSIDSN